MTHEHAGHGHGPPARVGDGRARAVLALILAFMVAEVVAGLLANSLALLSDAAHMLTDAFALATAIAALRIARRPPSGSHTYGLSRVEILSAQANGIALLLIAAAILYEAIARLVHPSAVHATVVLVVALCGAAVNVAAVRLLAPGRKLSMALEGSFQHVATDLFAFAATALAALVILLTGFERADAIAALLVAALMIRSGVRLVAQSWRIFLESAPQSVQVEEVGRSLAALSGVEEVHDLHVWEIAPGYPALSAHVTVLSAGERERVAREMEALLHERFAIDHTTLQVDVAGSELVQLQRAPDWSRPTAAGRSGGSGSR